MTPRRIAAAALWAAALILWTDALAPGSPLLAPLTAHLSSGAKRR